MLEVWARPLASGREGDEVSTVDVDAMFRAAQQVDWSSWQPDPSDPTLTTRVRDDEPPLTAWMVQQLVDVNEWLVGRPLTPKEVAEQQQGLIEIWTKAWTEMNYSAVHTALANIAFWDAIRRLPKDQQQVVREELRRRHAAASPKAAADAEELQMRRAQDAMTAKLVRDLIGGPKPPGFF